jgi:hypothetical protein
MGRKSRSKADRRNGVRRPTQKELLRADIKAQRRGRCVPPTVDAYGQVAVAGPDRLAHALIARHSARMENLPAISDYILERCCQQMFDIHGVISEYGGGDRCPKLLVLSTDRRWPDHMAWAADSTMTAVRLLLCGQIVGAAVIAQQQLGRWALLLAQQTGAEQRPYESADELIARTWTRRAIEMLGRRTADVLAEARFDDVDDEMTAAGSTTSTYERIRLADGRKVCPAAVYRGLRHIMNGTVATSSSVWECVDNLEPAAIPEEIKAAVECVSDGLELCTMNLRNAVAAFRKSHGNHVGAQGSGRGRTRTHC